MNAGNADPGAGGTGSAAPTVETGSRVTAAGTPGRGGPDRLHPDPGRRRRDCSRRRTGWPRSSPGSSCCGRPRLCRSPSPRCWPWPCSPIFGLTSLVSGRPPTPGAIFGAAAANFMSSVFFFVLVMFAIAYAWVKTGLARRFALWLIARGGHRRHPRRVRVHDRHRHDLPRGLRRAGRRHLHGHRRRHPRQAGTAAGVAVRPCGDDRHSDRGADRRRRHAGRQLHQPARPRHDRAGRRGARPVPALDGDRDPDGGHPAAGGGLGAAEVLSSGDRVHRRPGGDPRRAAPDRAGQHRRVEGHRDHEHDDHFLDSEHVAAGFRHLPRGHGRRGGDVLAGHRPVHLEGDPAGHRLGHPDGDRRRDVAGAGVVAHRSRDVACGVRLWAASPTGTPWP